MLIDFKHLPRGLYLLGAEDYGIPPKILDKCQEVVKLPGTKSLNQAVAGSIVICDRMMKLGE